MKIIFICFNYLTLYKAICNINKVYADCECLIIFRTSVSDAPSNIHQYYKVIEISVDRERSNKYLDVIQWGLVIRRTVDAMKMEIDTAKQMILVVFKDNEKVESTLIEKFKEYTRQTGKVVLMDEGIGIYEKYLPRKTLGFKWAMVQKCFGMSAYFLNNYPQGFNPLVDEVVCSDVSLFVQKGRDYLKVSEQRNLFTFENCRFFIEEIMGYFYKEIEKYMQFDHVFLTQPEESFLLTGYDENDILNDICINSGKRILIKKHPRDRRSKCNQENKNTMIYELEDKFNDIPFECLYGIMNSPVVITYCSSAYKNIIIDNEDAKIILLYKLLNDRRINKIMEDLEQNYDKRIFIPDSMEELGRIVRKIANTNTIGAQM